MALFCRFLELGINQRNISAVIAGKDCLHGPKRLHGEKFLRTRNDARAVPQDIEAH